MNKMGESKIMKKYKGVVFFDYDGTTVDEVDEIKTATPTTVESLNKLKENGYLTMLCSGRTQRFLEMDIDKFMGAITCNGSHTEVEGEVTRDICIPDELVFQVVNEYFPRDTIIHFETRDISYYLHMDEEFFKNHCKLFNLPQRWYAPWKFRTKNTHISKLVMNYKDIQVKKDFEEEFKDVFTCAKHVRENFIDITLKGVTKGDAITELIEKLGIDKKDTYAFGDADNDVEMMQAVGTGIAMGRHSEKVGEVASMVTGILNIRPSLFLKNGEVNVSGLCRTRKKSVANVFESCKKYFTSRNIDPNTYDISVASATTPDECDELRRQVEEDFKIKCVESRERFDLRVSSITGVHTGPTTIGIGIMPKYETLL